MRWPKFFSNAELAEALFHDPEWHLLLEDLRDKVDTDSYMIIHTLPANTNDVAEQNFVRGKISAFEQLLDLAKEYQEWKESKKS